MAFGLPCPKDPPSYAPSLMAAGLEDLCSPCPELFSPALCMPSVLDVGQHARHKGVLQLLPEPHPPYPSNYCPAKLSSSRPTRSSMAGTRFPSPYITAPENYRHGYHTSPFFWNTLGAVSVILCGFVFILNIYIIPDIIMSGLEEGHDIGRVLSSASIPIYALLLITVSGTMLVIIARRLIRYSFTGTGKS